MRLLTTLTGEHTAPARNLTRRIEARLRARRQRLAVALAAKPGFFRIVCHASGSGHIAQGQQQVIVFALFQYRDHVLSNGRVVAQVAGGVKRDQFGFRFGQGHRS